MDERNSQRSSRRSFSWGSSNNTKKLRRKSQSTGSAMVSSPLAQPRLSKIPSLAYDNTSSGDAPRMGERPLRGDHNPASASMASKLKNDSNISLAIQKARPEPKFELQKLELAPVDIDFSKDFNLEEYFSAGTLNSASSREETSARSTTSLGFNENVRNAGPQQPQNRLSGFDFWPPSSVPSTRSSNSNLHDSNGFDIPIHAISEEPEIPQQSTPPSSHPALFSEMSRSDASGLETPRPAFVPGHSRDESDATIKAPTKKPGVVRRPPNATPSISSTARADNSSTRDLTDFIRSAGAPTKDIRSPPANRDVYAGFDTSLEPSMDSDIIDAIPADFKPQRSPPPRPEPPTGKNSLDLPIQSPSQSSHIPHDSGAHFSHLASDTKHEPSLLHIPEHGAKAPAPLNPSITRLQTGSGSLSSRPGSRAPSSATSSTYSQAGWSPQYPARSPVLDTPTSHYSTKTPTAAYNPALSASGLGTTIHTPHLSDTFPQSNPYHPSPALSLSPVARHGPGESAGSGDSSAYEDGEVYTASVAQGYRSPSTTDTPVVSRGHSQRESLARASGEWPLRPPSSDYSSSWRERPSLDSPSSPTGRAPWEVGVVEQRGQGVH